MVAVVRGGVVLEVAQGNRNGYKENEQTDAQQVDGLSFASILAMLAAPVAVMGMSSGTSCCRADMVGIAGYSRVVKTNPLSLPRAVRFVQAARKLVSLQADSIAACMPGRQLCAWLHNMVQAGLLLFVCKCIGVCVQGERGLRCGAVQPMPACDKVELQGGLLGVHQCPGPVGQDGGLDYTTYSSVLPGYVVYSTGRGAQVVQVCSCCQPQCCCPYVFSRQVSSR